MLEGRGELCRLGLMRKVVSSNTQPQTRKSFRSPVQMRVEKINAHWDHPAVMNLVIILINSHPEVGIYKRKQELHQESDQEKKKVFFFFSRSLGSGVSRCLSLAFLVEFLFSFFLERFLGWVLVFFYKFPPLASVIKNQQQNICKVSREICNNNALCVPNINLLPKQEKHVNNDAYVYGGFHLKKRLELSFCVGRWVGE